MLHEGFKTWNAKKKLQYENISMENEPQQNEWHVLLSSVHFSLSESFEFLVRFSCPTCPIYRPTCSVDSNADSHQQNTAKRKANLSRGSILVDKETRGSEGMLVLSVRKILTIFHGNIAYFGRLKMFFFFLILAGLFRPVIFQMLTYLLLQVWSYNIFIRVFKRFVYFQQTYSKCIIPSTLKRYHFKNLQKITNPAMV